MKLPALCSRHVLKTTVDEPTTLLVVRLLVECPNQHDTQDRKHGSNSLIAVNHLGERLLAIHQLAVALLPEARHAEEWNEAQTLVELVRGESGESQTHIVHRVVSEEVRNVGRCQLGILQ